MIQAIAIVVILLIVILAIKGALKHMKGEGECCGGGSSGIIIEKKLDGPIVCTKKIKIDGMHCDKCKSRVLEALNSIDGVNAHVSLNQGEATIEADREISDDLLIEAINKAGYQATVSPS